MGWDIITNFLFKFYIVILFVLKILLMVVSFSFINSVSFVNSVSFASNGILKEFLNSFGKVIMRDVDADGDKDLIVIFDSIANGNKDDYGTSLYVDKNYRVYVTGFSFNGINNDMYVIRLNSDGTLDKSFGTNGKVVFNSIANGDGDDFGFSIYVDSYGKIYVTGESFNGVNSDIYVIKLNSDGNIDSTFGNNGKVIFNSVANGNDFDTAYSLFVYNNKIYVTGSSFNGKNDDMYVIRLTTNGKIDKSFGTNGKVVFNNIANGNGDDFGNSIYVDNYKAVYITGNSFNGRDSDMYVIKLTANGKIDRSFGTNGKVVFNNIANGNKYDFGNFIYVDSYNKIYVTGNSFNGRDSDVYVIRLTTKGVLDKSFGINGKVVFNNIANKDSDDFANSLYLDNLGNLYLTGRSDNNMFVIKLNSNGSLDKSFGKSGKIVIPNITSKSSSDEGNSIYVDTNGKVFVTGNSFNNRNYDMYVLKIE